LWRTPRGSLPWQPDYGTVIYQFRTQSFNDADTAFLQEDLLRATAQWIPDIVILEIQFVPGELIGEEDERLQIQCAWGIPDATNAGARDTGAPRFAFGPVTQTITV
jgi:phage baseplate assembly protein W